MVYFRGIYFASNYTIEKSWWIYPLCKLRHTNDVSYKLTTRCIALHAATPLSAGAMVAANTISAIFQNEYIMQHLRNTLDIITFYS